MDLDAFFASVEQLDNPELRGKPVIVGGLGGRGVVTAASYEARKFGVHSAQPMTTAQRLCPQAIFCSPRFDAYAHYSERVMKLLGEITPKVEQISTDEAFMDVISVAKLWGGGEDIARMIRERIRSEIGLVVSVGVATSKLLAKLASDAAKPDGCLVIAPGDELVFVHPLPVEQLWGVGRKTFARLQRYGVRTIGDLARIPMPTLIAAVGPTYAQHLHSLAWCRDEREVESSFDRKSIGHEETFRRDIRSSEELHARIVGICEKVSNRLRKNHEYFRTVQLKVRFADFHTITRSRTLSRHSQATVDVLQAALELVQEVDISRGVRLIGVALQQLQDTGEIPLELPFKDAETLDATLDTVWSRFGPDAVIRASAVVKKDAGPADTHSR